LKIQIRAHRKTVCLHYKCQSLTSALGNVHCSVWESYETETYTMWRECKVFQQYWRWYLYALISSVQESPP